MAARLAKASQLLFNSINKLNSYLLVKIVVGVAYANNLSFFTCLMEMQNLIKLENEVLLYFIVIFSVIHLSIALINTILNLIFKFVEKRDFWLSATPKTEPATTPTPTPSPDQDSFIGSANKSG